MRLEQLAITPLANAQSAAIDICGLTADSRLVQPGYLFAALVGVQADGRAFIGQAIKNGAVAVLADMKTSADVPIVNSDNPRRDFALMAARFFATQPAHIACVTGTNGKTSTAAFVRQLLAACHIRVASIGTLGVEADSYFAQLQHTTPEPVRLHAALRDLVAHRVTHAVLEASSHGLAQHRLDGVKIAAAGFTNLSRDHLDYHKDADEYEAAKRRLFTECLADEGMAVINMTSEAGTRMAQACADAGRRMMQVGRDGDGVHVTLGAHTPTGLQLNVTLNGQSQKLDVPLIGDFQTDNLAVALGLALAFGVSEAQLFKACAFLQAPRGRMQFIGRTQSGAAAYVDYAHTPDALKNALTALHAHRPKAGRLLVMFGCGGDRDSGKRSQMGAVAAQLADIVYVTDDNPRHETPSDIRAAIMVGCPEAIEIADRKSAIMAILNEASAGDLVLLAGKGHETGQIFGDTILPFDDVTVGQSITVTQGEQNG